METNSSREELVVKARRPYTITKQREKWTEEEHGKFIEALKLYGRGWQRIEEHIGTKTAVQIRSHAQKFFTKLEKEAVMKGVPFGQAHEIKIPPPRPKRKPSRPYPRKTGAGSLSSSAEATDEKTSKSQSSLSTCKQSINIDDYAAWKFDQVLGAKDNSEDGSCSEVLNVFQDARAASNSSLSKGPKGFVPLEKEMRDKATLKDSSRSIGLNKDMKENGTVNANLGNKELKGAAISKWTDEIGQSDQSCAKNTPIDFMKGNINANPSLHPTIPSTSEMNANSGVSSSHHSFQTFPPCTQFQTNQDPYQSFLNISSTFSNLIISTLLQNPAVHAAASMAASFWPSTGLDASTASYSESVLGGMPNTHLNPNTSMAAIADATVAAASAWWATHGLLPMYPPLHTRFAFAPSPATAIPTANTAAAPVNRKEERGKDTLKNSIAIDEQDVDPEQPEAVRASSSSDSGESGRIELSSGKTNKFGMDTDKARNTKKLDRSSCGSNTPSSSEVETDAVLKKQDGDQEVEPKQVHLNINPPSLETNTRRIRSSTGIMNESWKEVSEEGRVAFQALFNREVLPQSFSPPHANESMLMAAKDKEGTGELQVDLNMKALSEPADIYYVQGAGDTPSKNSFSSDSSHGKQKVRRTGFKPYKRCSIEANESRATAGDENGNKRIRLEGKTVI